VFFNFNFLLSTKKNALGKNLSTKYFEKRYLQNKVNDGEREENKKVEERLCV
jgi:hypothetical protein